MSKLKRQSYCPGLRGREAKTWSHADVRPRLYWHRGSFTQAGCRWGALRRERAQASWVGSTKSTLSTLLAVQSICSPYVVCFPPVPGACVSVKIPTSLPSFLLRVSVLASDGC